MGFTFKSPAISAKFVDGRWIITREGKGDWLEFNRFGGYLYQSRRTEPVGSIYIYDLPGASSDPYFSYWVTHTTECGCEFKKDIIEMFSTPSEAVEEAAFLFIS